MTRSLLFSLASTIIQPNALRNQSLSYIDISKPKVT